MNDMINKFINIKKKLRILKIEIDEQHAIGSMSNALPISLRSSIESWDLFNDTEQSLEKFINKLQEWSRTLSEIEENTALLTSINNQRQQSDMECY